MGLKLPSLQLIAGDAARSARRFPEVLATALLAAGAAVLLVDRHGDPSALVRLLLTAQLGIPFFLVLTLGAERLGREGRARAGAILQAASQVSPDSEDLLYVYEEVARASGDNAMILDYLEAHATQHEFCCRFRWQPNSIAMWDNRCTMHNALNDDLAARKSGQGFKRVMRRSTIKI